jgi:uncharacterized protein (DUF302 family)
MNQARKLRKGSIKEMQKHIYSLLLVIALLLVPLAGPVMAQSNGQPIVVKSSNSFDITVKKLKDAIKGKGLSIVFEANHQNMMKMIGIESKKSIALGFAKPQMASKFLSIEPRAALEMPMRIAIRELNDGSVVVIYYRPSYLFSHYENNKLTMMAKKKVDPMVEAFVRAATT